MPVLKLFDPLVQLYLVMSIFHGRNYWTLVTWLFDLFPRHLVRPSVHDPHDPLYQWSTRIK